MVPYVRFTQFLLAITRTHEMIETLSTKLAGLADAVDTMGKTIAALQDR